MKGQTGVLQERVEVLPVEGRHRHAQERVGGEQDKEEKRHADHGLNTQHPRPQRGRQVGAEPRHRRAKERDNEHPQEHRAFVIAPDTRHLVEHRLVRVAVEHHQTQREIRGDKGICQRGKGHSRQQELDRSRRFGHGHPARPAFIGAYQGDSGLNAGHQKGEDEGEVTEFCNHVLNIGQDHAPANRNRHAPWITLSRGSTTPPPLCQRGIVRWG